MHTQPKYNIPFDKARLENAPKGIYIPNDYVYDKEGHKHHIPNRRQRRLIENKKVNNSNELKMSH